MDTTIAVGLLTILCSSPYFIDLCIKRGGIFTDKNMTTPYKIVFGILVLSMILEFIRGNLHFFFPKKSHTEVSKITDTFGLDEDDVKSNPLYLVTLQFGAANLLLGFMYMIILIINAYNVNMIKIVFIITFFVRILQEGNRLLKFWASDIYNIPEDSSVEAPGKDFQIIQSIVLIIGFIFIALEQVLKKGKNV